MSSAIPSWRRPGSSRRCRFPSRARRRRSPIPCSSTEIACARRCRRRASASTATTFMQSGPARRRRRRSCAVSEPLRVERDVPRAGTWRLVLDDATRANALSPRLVSSLQASLHAAFASDARAIVLDSSGERFCAGSDLADIDRLDDADLRERFGAIEDLLETLRRAPTLTIAVVRGAALGAGADLVASCDYRIGTSGARLAFPGSRLGVVLGTRHLAGVVGRQLAREILVEGRMLDAQAAAACGLLSSLCAEGEVAQRVDDILRGSEALDIATLCAILALTRDVPSGRDRSELLRSVWREGLAERVREHAGRARDERAARRVNDR